MSHGSGFREWERGEMGPRQAVETPTKPVRVWFQGTVFVM